MTGPYSDEEIGGLGSGPRYPLRSTAERSADEPCVCGTDFTCLADEHDFAVLISTALTAERARFALIANAAEQIARDAAKDPGGYSDGAEGFRWAAEHIRSAIKESE